jgi:hypothetical protein
MPIMSQKRHVLKTHLRLNCFLVFLLLFTVCVSLRCQANTYGDYTYSVSGTNVTIIFYTGSSGNLSIPSTIPGVGTVTAIAHEAFSECGSLKSVTIPNSVISIDYMAFYDCSNMTSVIIPNSVTHIGREAFGSTGLTSVTMPNSLTYIEDSLFSYCERLTSITIPNSVTAIGNYVFYACSNLTSVNIPNNVTWIGDEAFAMTSLTSVTIPNGMNRIGSGMFLHCKNLKNVTIPNSINWILNSAFADCPSLTSVSIPSSVTYIEYNAFEYCTSLKTAYFQGDAPPAFGENVFYKTAPGFTIYYPSVGTGWSTPTWNGYSALPYAMSNGAVKVILLPADAANYGAQWRLDGGLWQSSGSWCIGLTAGSHIVTFKAPSGWTAPPAQTVTVSAHSLTVITNTYVPFSYSANGTNVTITGYLGTSGDVTIPSTIPRVGTVTAIGDRAFWDCATLRSVILPDSITSVGTYAFASCTNLTSATLPGSLTSINLGMFFFCINLTNVTIPNSVTNIGESTFSSCTDLISVCFQGDAPTSFGSNVFDDTASGFAVYYPSNAMGWSTPTWNGYAAMAYGDLKVVLLPAEAVNAGAQWQMDGGEWQNSGNTLSELIPGSRTINFNTLVGWLAPSKQVITINPGAVTSITGIYTPFDFTYSVTGTNVTITGYLGAGGEVAIPSSIRGVGTVTAIGANAFSWRDSVTGITIPDSVTSIADYSFNQCANLVRVTIPESVTYIGNYAFNYCTSLTNVTLPGKVTRIGNAAFRNCTSLTSVNIPNGVTNIENFVFESCNGLTNVILPDYLVSIGDSAFSACAGLTNLTLPVCVTNIGNSAFSPA